MTQDQLFICLANSTKYTDRCIAGIKLVESTSPGRKYDIVKDGDRPVWVRPVSDHDRGEVDQELVKDIRLLNIVRVRLERNARLLHQTENWTFDQGSFEVVGTVSPEARFLDKLVSPESGALFGSSGHKVMAESIGGIDHSLLLIKPQDLRFYYQQRDDGPPKLRAKFEYHRIEYDLAITDPVFVDRRRFTPNEFRLGAQHVYLTVSLGSLYKGAYFKLVAGVIVANS